MRATSSCPYRVLNLPGWMNSGPAHWQSHWERLYGIQRVEQADWLWPRRGDWLARLDEVLLEDERPAVLVAHSLGCQLVAAWAMASQYRARVRAALLVAPPDTDRSDMPPQLHGWRPMARAALSFPALALMSTDDPYCDLTRARGLAADWGAQAQVLGPFGHLNGESGLGEWPEGWALLNDWLATVG